MTIAFRSADLSDLNLLLQLHKYLNKHEGTTYDTPRTRTALEGFIGHPEFGEIWMICDDGVPIGYIVINWGYSLEFGGRLAFVDEMFVEDEYRNRGIGRRSIEFVEERCRFLNIKALYLEVAKENMTAQGFYQRVGFSHRDEYTIMAKDLGTSA